MNRSTAGPVANSFVQSLQGIRNTRKVDEFRRNNRSTSFTISKATEEPASTEQVSFDAAALESEDPLCPNIRLVKRYMSHEEVKRAMPSDTDVMTITDLYKQVSPPDFKRPPNSQPNLVLLGIVATRSESRTSAAGNQYVTMTLSDLKYDISLALHGVAREKYWKVRPGTLIALFNPTFYVQKSEKEARNLALSCAKDTCLLEIGQAKDLGQCESMTSASKNTKRCRNWVDVRRTHFCDFHLEQTVARSKRPEFNSSSGKLWDPKNTSSGKRLTVVRGGEVSWKQGLQFDVQANQGRYNIQPNKQFGAFKGGFPDAPVGRVFSRDTSAPPKKFDNRKYEEAIGDKKKRLERDKRALERITDDNDLKQRLGNHSRSSSHRSHPQKAVPGGSSAARSGVSKETPAVAKPSSQFGTIQLRRLGFMPAAVLANPKGVQRLTPPKPRGHDDSDSDLEIY